MATLVDFTKLRKGTRAPDGRRIAVCPKCGRKGGYVQYKNGDINVSHSGYVEQVGVFTALTINDHCMVPAKNE